VTTSTAETVIVPFRQATVLSDIFVSWAKDREPGALKAGHDTGRGRSGQDQLRL